MARKDKNALSNYNASYYRDNRERLKKRQRMRYQEKKDEINAKAREKRRLEKERKDKEDRKNGIWDF